MGIFGDGQRRRVAAKAYKPASEILQVLCDGCHAAWAKVEVITGAGSVFLCQHHHKKYRNSIIAAGHQIRAALGHPRPKPMPGCLDLGSGAVSPARASHALARFQLLVGQEEVLDSSRSNSPGRGCRVGIPDAGHRRGRIGPCRRPHFVDHPEHAERTAADQAAGERGFLHENQRVKRIAIFAEGARHP